jgi:uncharacterized membrane protein YkvA (DUF1232 family)
MASALREWARSIKRDAHALYLAARDPRTPWYAKILAVCVAAYALSPIDLIPDFIPVLGYLDDMVIVPLGILAVVKLIRPEVMAEHRAAAAQAEERPVSRTAVCVIVFVWAASIALTGWLVYRNFVP